MRRTSAFVALACLAALLTACPDEENNNADATTADSGVTDRGGGNPDAVNADVDTFPDAEADGGDAGFPDAAPQEDATPTGPVTVRMIQQEMPAVNIPVVFHDSTGAVLSSTVTDMNGEAKYELPVNGMITSYAIPPFGGPGPGGEGGEGGSGAGGPPTLHTIAGVQPGDTYVWPLDFGPGVLALVGSMLVTLPGNFMGADFYSIDIGCNAYPITDPVSAESVDVLDSCVGTSTIVDVLAQARDVNYEVIGYAVARNVPIASNVPVAFPPWEPSLIREDFSLINAPGVLTAGDVELHLVRRGIRYNRLTGNETFMSGGARIPFQVPDFGDARDVSIEMEFSIAAGSIFAAREAVGTPLAYDYVLDELTYFTGVALDRNADPTRPTITWTIGQGTPQTFLMVLFNTDIVSWTVLVPPTATEVKQPALPDDLAMLRPDANTMYLPPIIFFVNNSNFSDYANYRTTLGPLGFVGIGPATQLDGTPIGTRISGAAFGIR